MGFWHTNRSPNLSQTTRPYNSQQQKKNLQNKKKVNKRISTGTLRGIWKKLWNMKVTNIPIVINAFGTVTKGLLKGLKDEWRPSKLLHYGEQPENWEESWRLEETCCHSNSSERPSADTDMKLIYDDQLPGGDILIPFFKFLRYFPILLLLNLHQTTLKLFPGQFATHMCLNVIAERNCHALHYRWTRDEDKDNEISLII